jgi:hypothetical protein
VLEGHSTHEEVAKRVERSIDAESRKTGRIGTPPRIRSTSDFTFGGREDK